MPRYIDADKTMEEIDRIGGHNLCEWETLGVKALIDRQPTADVVPKSEYDAVVSAVDNSTKEFLKLHDEYQSANAEIERLKHILDCYALQYGTVTEQQRVIDKAKAEAAKEIFAEIENILEDNKAFLDGDIYFEYDIQRHFAELKKKYTE